MEEKIDYEYEYGRYKKKVEQLFRENRELKEEAAGHMQLMEAAWSFAGAVLAAFNVGKDNPIILDREAVSAAVKGQELRCVTNKEETEYKLWVEKKK